jgi:hypothetical protein
MWRLISCAPGSALTARRNGDSCTARRASLVRHYAGPADVLHPFDATSQQRRAFRSLAYCRRDVRGALRRAMNLQGTKLAGPILPTDTGDAR